MVALGSHSHIHTPALTSWWIIHLYGPNRLIFMLIDAIVSGSCEWFCDSKRHSMLGLCFYRMEGDDFYRYRLVSVWSSPNTLLSPAKIGKEMWKIIQPQRCHNLERKWRALVAAWSLMAFEIHLVLRAKVVKDEHLRAGSDFLERSLAMFWSGFWNKH